MSATINEVVQRFLEELSLDVAEERIVNYIVREVRLGRKLSAVIQDPYIKNRVDAKRLGEIMENKEVIEAVDAELEQAFKDRDFKFKE
jgi:hypothetical protein